MTCVDSKWLIWWLHIPAKRAAKPYKSKRLKILMVNVFGVLNRLILSNVAALQTVKYKPLLYTFKRHKSIDRDSIIFEHSDISLELINTFTHLSLTVENATHLVIRNHSKLFDLPNEWIWLSQKCKILYYIRFFFKHNVSRK